MSKNLKPFPWPKELLPETEQLAKTLRDGDDLTCALIGGAFVDHCLASLIQSYLAKGNTSLTLLQPSRGLGEYSSRRMLCYSLGLITKQAGEDLETIGSIRNKFAHGFFDVTFQDEVIAKLCRKLHAGNVAIVWLDEHTHNTPRRRFTTSVLVHSHLLLSEALVTEHRPKKVSTGKSSNRTRSDD